MITVEKVSKIHYQGKIAVNALTEISMQVTMGKICCIMGKSGSGKSTLLRIIGLIDQPTSGKVWIEGHDATKMSEKERTFLRLSKLGYVFQESALIPELSALENVCLPGLQLKGSKKHVYNRGRELLEIVGLQDRIGHRPGELSGGEQQRVSIARALINKPKIIFADEPTANLDSFSAIMAMFLLAKLNRELGVTIVFVTHDPDHHRYADQILNMRDGKLVDVQI